MIYPLDLAMAFGELEISQGTVIALILVTLFIFSAVAISSLTLFRSITGDDKE